jgi:8-oxo-dGTP pyrophosphatase MutT (NUDIX family)
MAEYVSEHGHPFSDDTRDKVGVIVLDRYGYLLLVEGKEGKLSLPKGGRHRGETDLEGALREAWEETGIDLDENTYTDKIKLVWGNYFIYHLPMEGRDIPLRPQPGETVKILWRKPTSYWIRHDAILNRDLAHYIHTYDHLNGGCKKRDWGKHKSDITTHI